MNWLVNMPKWLWRLAGVVVVAALCLAGYGLVSASRAPATNAGLSRVLTAIERGEASRATLDATHDQVRLVLSGGEIVVAAYPRSYVGTLIDRLSGQGVELSVSRPGTGPDPSLLLQAGLLVLLAAIGVGLLSRLRSGRRVSKALVPSERFSDVAGCDEAIEQVRECVEFLRSADKFTAAGARRPNGLLLIGEPGIGKTLIARAVAGEAGVPFYAVAGSEFVEVFAGVGAARVRALFAQARRTGGVVFFDELDTVGRARSVGAAPDGSVRERDATLNQLLVELDGFLPNDRVLVSGATNRADILDPALVRPGRFDRVVTVPLPDVDGRAAILAVHAADKRFADSAGLWSLARRTEGMTGADLARLLNEAAILAARHGRDSISLDDLESALVDAAMGRERKASLSRRDREVLAWHEAGRAVAMLAVPDASPPVRVSIVPRGAMCGATWAETSETTLVTKREAMARLVVLMAGRAAEEVFAKGFSNASAPDYGVATAIATNMVAEWGMGDFKMRLDPEVSFCQELIVLGVAALLGEAYATAVALMGQEHDAVAAVKEELLTHGTITGHRAKTLRDSRP